MTAPGSDVNGLVEKLATWTNVILLVMLALTVGVVLYPSLAGAVASSPAPAPPAYQVGSRIDTPHDWHAGSPFTLVLFAQSRCGACQRAQPFLKQVVEELAERAPVVLVSPSADLAEEIRFGESLGLGASAVRRAPAGIRARVTPTLVLVDRHGTILHVWEGVPPDRQAGIIRTLADAAGRKG